MGEMRAWEKNDTECLMLGLFILRVAVPLIVFTAILLSLTLWARTQAIRFLTVIDTLPVQTMHEAHPESDGTTSKDASEPSTGAGFRNAARNFTLSRGASGIMQGATGMLSAGTGVITGSVGNVMSTITDPSKLKKLDIAKILLPGLTEAQPVKKDSAVSARSRTLPRDESMSSLLGTAEEKPYEFPTHEQLVNYFAHPSASTKPIHIWIPDCPGAPEVLEILKRDILGDSVEVEVLGEDGKTMRRGGLVLTSFGADVDNTGLLRVKATAVAKKVPE
jgi:hypothetical protein